MKTICYPDLEQRRPQTCISIDEWKKCHIVGWPHFFYLILTNKIISKIEKEAELIMALLS